MKARRIVFVAYIFIEPLGSILFLLLPNQSASSGNNFQSRQNRDDHVVLIKCVEDAFSIHNWWRLLIDERPLHIYGCEFVFVHVNNVTLMGLAPA
jgi:hypothetical protein